MVGLAVLLAVAVLFILNICLCVWKILHSEENNGHTGSGWNRNRRANPNSRSLPVIFVNPGGSVRIGKKSKTGAEGSDGGGAESLPDHYYFDEVEFDHPASFEAVTRSASMELPRLNRTLS